MKTKTMKKAICTALCLAFLLVPAGVGTAAESTADSAAAAAPQTSAEAYVLYCPSNGTVICSQNADKKMKPASTTKIMTALITLEYAAEDDREVMFTTEMIAEGSSMYLKEGERLRLSDLAAGMMMASGNDAANAAAYTIAGSPEKFAELMNEKAAQIGMRSTHFVTPSGLDDDEHYTTAEDMALLMAYALENKDFAALTAQKSAEVDFIEPSDKKTVYTNHNRLLSMYEYCTGGKTGYTMAAGRCLVSSAEKDGVDLVCVTLNDKNDWNDHASLYNYGFENYRAYICTDSDFYADEPCVGGSADTVTVTGECDGSFAVSNEDYGNVLRTVYLDAFLYAPVKAGQNVGVIRYTLDGETLYECGIAAGQDVPMEN